MSRNVYRLCNTSHIQSKPANATIYQTIAYWLGQLFSKPKLTMVCVSPAPAQLQKPLTNNKISSVSHCTPDTQKIQATDTMSPLEQAQELSYNRSSSSHIQSSIPSSGVSLARAGKKANMLFLKVYNGPIFQDKKIDQTANANISAQTKPNNPNRQTGPSIKDPFCPPNFGLYPACLQMLNSPATVKKPVFISGKMSDIFAQLDQLAA